jgi:hypothetical protein
MAKVVIPLFYHLDRRIWTDSLTATTELTQIEIGQNNSIDFAVRFCNAGVATQLTGPTPVWICAIKAINDFAGLNLLLTTTGVLVGTGAASVYTFTLLIDSTELRSWLLTVTGITALASFEIRDTNNNIATLPALTCSILPDYTLVGTTPTSASGTLVVASGKTFTVSQTLAMPTDNGTAGFVLRTDGAGVGTWVANTLGSVTSVGLGVIGGGTVLSITGTPVTSSGTLGIIVAGTSGGLLYFSSPNTMGSSATLGVGALIVGGGSGLPPSSVSPSLAGRVLISTGTLSAPMYSTTPTLGASGTLGTIAFGNATTSGGILTIAPPTGLYSSATITLPNATTTLAGLAVTQSFTAVNTFSSSTASTSTTSGAVVVTGGLGVGGNAYVGGVINLPATTATAGKIIQAGNNLLHTFGTENLFLGSNAGNTTGSGQYSVGVGTRAMFSLTTGRQNLCFGWQAGYYITTGWDNMIFGGYNTGHGISTGSGNTIIGASADATNGNYRGAIGAGASCTADDTIVIGKAAGTYSVAGTPGSRSADAVIIRGALTVSGGATIASGQALKLGNAATTGLTAGVLAATTNATITITDSAGQVYRIPCII